MKNVGRLLSGIDTLNLSINVEWSKTNFLNSLHSRLAEAQSIRKEVPFILTEEGESGGIPFMLQPHGKQGYTWLLLGTDYCLRVMDWITPKSRPSIIAELRSELLWRLGPLEAIQRLVAALEHQGGIILSVKPSRADLCMDVLFHEEDWNSSLMENMVTRANSDEVFRKHQELTGIAIGRGVLSARIYDKGKEIATQSGKTWFYDLWGFKEIPEGRRVVRIEFQLRREVLKELGCKNLEAFVLSLPHLWSYCTKKWLKFMTKPGEHHTQRKTLAWWRAVQDSFMGMDQGEPLIRAKAIESVTRRLRQQATGLCSSIIALDMDAQNNANFQDVAELDYPRVMEEALEALGKTVHALQEDVAKKHIKRSRLQKKYAIAKEQWNRLGLVEGVEEEQP